MADLPEPEAVWSRQRGESSQAYSAFCQYRDSHPRSLRQLAEKLGRAAGPLMQWSARWGWVERCAEYDRHLDREWQEEVGRLRRVTARRTISLTSRALRLVEQRLDMLAAKDLSPSDVARLFEVAVKLERLALGEPSKVEVSGPDKSALKVEIESLSPAERQDRMAQLLQEGAKRAGLRLVPADQPAPLPAGVPAATVAAAGVAVAEAELADDDLDDDPEWDGPGGGLTWL